MESARERRGDATGTSREEEAKLVTSPTPTSAPIGANASSIPSISIESSVLNAGWYPMMPGMSVGSSSAPILDIYTATATSSGALPPPGYIPGLPPFAGLLPRLQSFPFPPVHLSPLPFFPGLGPPPGGISGGAPPPFPIPYPFLPAPPLELAQPAADALLSMSVPSRQSRSSPRPDGSEVPSAEQYASEYVPDEVMEREEEELAAIPRPRLSRAERAAARERRREEMPGLFAPSAASDNDSDFEEAMADSEGGPYHCRSCGASFRTPTRLASHERRWHITRAARRRPRSNNRKGSVPCTQCDRTFSSQGNLRQHIRTAHEGERHRCQHCSVAFTTRQVLLDHITTVHDHLTFPCPFCLATFTGRRNRRRHLGRLHNLSIQEAEEIALSQGVPLDPISPADAPNRRLAIIERY